MTPAESQEYFPTSADMPAYPPGLTISLCGDELEKLGVDFEDLCVDDMIHMHCLAVIVSKHKSENQGQDDSERICLQITHMQAEDESDEDEEAETSLDKLYK